jgi:Ca2+-binding EF-hand superfamily protein
LWLHGKLIQPQRRANPPANTGTPSLKNKTIDIFQLIATCPVIFFKTNLLFLVDYSAITNISGLSTVTEKEGYNAMLICVSRNGSEPLIVPLKIDLKQSQAAIPFGYDKPVGRWSIVTESTWMYIAGDCLYIGQTETLGIWVIPISEIKAAIDVQEQALLAKKRLEDEARRQLQAKLLAKYDRNNNGVIDPDEKEEALDDPVFIESELDLIDANQNGWLDANELAYFDANQNKILEPKEQAGIDVAQHLLAERLLKKFDANDDGVLGRSEFNELWQSGNFSPNTAAVRNMSGPFPDENHDGKIDLAELEAFLKQQTRGGMRLRGTANIALMNQVPSDPSKPIDASQMFKLSVESYWKTSGNVP